jgi:hypothetical protein
MARARLSPGDHGAVAVRRTTGSLADRAPFAASARFADPLTGEIQHVRRLGQDASDAKASLLTELGRRRRMPTLHPADVKTVGELLTWWFANFAPGLDWSTSTTKIYASIRRNHIEPALGAVLLEQMTPETIEQFLDALKGHRVRELARRLLDLILRFRSMDSHASIDPQGA